MEDLFINFADHLSHLISPTLGNRVKQYLKRRLSHNNNPEEYLNIENEIKAIMTNYFENASDKEYLDISANLYNSYVEYDDENFIKSVKMFVRIYSYYQELKMRKVLAKWRIKAIKLRVNNKNNYMTNKITNSNNNNAKALHRNNSAGFTKLLNKYGNTSYNNNKY